MTMTIRRTVFAAALLAMAAAIVAATAAARATTSVRGAGANGPTGHAPAPAADERTPEPDPPAGATGPAKPVAVNAFPPPAELGGQGWTYFRETGHYVAAGFKAYFEANGGLAAFGYPITEELIEDGWTVQYFQRARLEFHPEAPNAPVQRSLLGAMLWYDGYGAHVPAAVTADCTDDARGGVVCAPLTAPSPQARFFPETGFWVDEPFLSFFNRNGGVEAFGYPLLPVQGGGSVQWFQRARLEAAGGTVQAALIGDEYTDVVGLAHARGRAQPPQIGRAALARLQDDLEVYAAPGGAELVTRLPPDTQVRVTGEQRGPSGDVWYSVRLWNAVDGFVRLNALAFSPAPGKPASAGGTPWKPAQPPAQGPFPLAAAARFRVAADYAAVPDGPAAGRAAGGTPARLTAWATDGQGRAWFQFEAGGAAGWALAQFLSLDGPGPHPQPLSHADAGRGEPALAHADAGRGEPALAHADAGRGEPALATSGAPPAQAVAGKGMWFTYDVLRQTPPQHVVAAARANGFSFLAPEVGSSRRGYWAGGELDALLPLAHAAGLKVIPWVYPWLADLPADLDLALQAARHVAPTGDAVDGLAVDLEENLDEVANRAYGQLLRATLGPDQPLIAITYQPQIASGRRTPFGALVETFDVIVPMSYWHTRNVRYTYQDAHDYVAESVRLIRERTGRSDVPIAILGQTFDWFARNEIGPGNPTADEVRGAMQAARDTGTLGIGFFNWFHTTPEEWDVIGAFAW